jgi:hypothetical protein
VEEEEFWRIPTSATPLYRGHGGCHRTIRVTEYGGAAGCGALYTILRSSSERLRRLRQVNDYVDYMCRSYLWQCHTGMANRRGTMVAMTVSGGGIRHKHTRKYPGSGPSRWR